MNQPILIDDVAAGRLLNMLSARVVRLAKRGLLPCIKLPDGQLRFSADDLAEWVKSYRQPVTLPKPTDSADDFSLAEILPELADILETS